MNKVLEYGNTKVISFKACLLKWILAWAKKACDLSAVGNVRNTHLEKQWPLALWPSGRQTIWLMVAWPIYLHNLFALCSQYTPNIFCPRPHKVLLSTTFNIILISVVSNFEMLRMKFRKNWDFPSLHISTISTSSCDFVVVDKCNIFVCFWSDIFKKPVIFSNFLKIVGIFLSWEIWMKI